MEMATVNNSLIDISPSLFNADFMQNPYPVYDELRSMGRVARMSDGEGQTWVFTHFDDVTGLLKDSKRFSGRRTAELLKMIPADFRDEFKLLTDVFDMSVAFQDGEKHKRVRNVMNYAFDRYSQERLKQEVQASVDLLISRIKDKQEIDFVKEFAHPLPAMVIVRKLGIPLEQMEKYMERAEDVLTFTSDLATANFSKRGDAEFYATAKQVQAKLRQIMDDFLSMIDERKTQPKEDVISYMVTANTDGDEQLLSDDELAVQCIMLSFNGIETTRNLISSAMMLLLTHEEEKAKFAQDPGLVDSVVDEALRFESPLQSLRRIATEDIDYLGVPIQKDDAVLLFLGSAHRDPAKYERPDIFDITRKENKQIAFGFGPHYCIGAALSRMEATTSISTLFKHFPNISLKNVGQPPEWSMTPVLHGLARLDLKL